MISLITIMWCVLLGPFQSKYMWRTPGNLPLLQPDARSPRDHGLTTNDPAAPVIGSHMVPSSDADTHELTKKLKRSSKSLQKRPVSLELFSYGANCMHNPDKSY